MYLSPQLLSYTVVYSGFDVVSNLLPAHWTLAKWGGTIHAGDEMTALEEQNACVHVHAYLAASIRPELLVLRVEHLNLRDQLRSDFGGVQAQGFQHLVSGSLNRGGEFSTAWWGVYFAQLRDLPRLRYVFLATWDIFLHSLLASNDLAVTWLLCPLPLLSNWP